MRAKGRCLLSSGEKGAIAIATIDGADYLLKGEKA